MGNQASAARLLEGPANDNAASDNVHLSATRLAPGVRGHASDVMRLFGTVARRLKTGLPTLDRALRGGLQADRLVAVLGAPEGGKTTLVTCLLERFEAQGCVCFYFAADEEGKGIWTRLAQLTGHSRDRFESADDRGERERFVGSLHTRELRVIDPDQQPEQDYSLEDLIAEAEATAKRLGRPCCIAVDSIQTAPCTAAARKDSTRERVEAVVKVCKGAARRGALVVMISEMSRDGYKNRDPKENVTALAAGKESGSIEYAASIQIAVRPFSDSPEDQGKVWLEVAKNRGGLGKPSFCCRIDAETASFDELQAAQECPSSAPPKGRRRGGKPASMNVARSRDPFADLNLTEPV
jgi:KaiC/GvpD/RAD55 family RecA-like ATPase